MPWTYLTRFNFRSYSDQILPTHIFTHWNYRKYTFFSGEKMAKFWLFFLFFFTFYSWHLVYSLLHTKSSDKTGCSTCIIYNIIRILQIMMQKLNRQMSFSLYISALAVTDTLTLLIGQFQYCWFKVNVQLISNSRRKILKMSFYRKIFLIDV